MAFINTNIQQPGIIELLFYKANTGKALSNLAHTLLHGPSTLSKGERELIASYVSKLNECEFCHNSHHAAAKAHSNDSGKLADAVINDLSNSGISNKMKSLLLIAGKVQKNGKEVLMYDVENAKLNGASDEEIHDTVLIAAAFCMFNRYVDGLGTSLPENKEEYIPMGKRLAEKGYKYPPFFLRKFVLRLMNKKRK